MSVAVPLWIRYLTDKEGNPEREYWAIIKNRDRMSRVPWLQKATSETLSGVKLFKLSFLHESLGDPVKIQTMTL